MSKISFLKSFLWKTSDSKGAGHTRGKQDAEPSPQPSASKMTAAPRLPKLAHVTRDVPWFDMGVADRGGSPGETDGSRLWRGTVLDALKSLPAARLAEAPEGPEVIRKSPQHLGANASLLPAVEGPAADWLHPAETSMSDDAIRLWSQATAEALGQGPGGTRPLALEGLEASQEPAGVLALPTQVTFDENARRNAGASRPNDFPALSHHATERTERSAAATSVTWLNTPTRTGFDVPERQGTSTTAFQTTRASTQTFTALGNSTRQNTELSAPVESSSLPNTSANRTSTDKPRPGESITEKTDTADRGAPRSAVKRALNTLKPEKGFQELVKVKVRHFGLEFNGFGKSKPDSDGLYGRSKPLKKRKVNINDLRRATESDFVKHKGKIKQAGTIHLRTISETEKKEFPELTVAVEAAKQELTLPDLSQFQTGNAPVAFGLMIGFAREAVEETDRQIARTAEKLYTNLQRQKNLPMRVTNGVSSDPGGDAANHFILQLSRPKTDKDTQKPNAALGNEGILHDHDKLMKRAAVRGLALMCGVGPQAQLPSEKDLGWLLAKAISPNLSREGALADLRANKAWIYPELTAVVKDAKQRMALPDLRRFEEDGTPASIAPMIRFAKEAVGESNRTISKTAERLYATLRPNEDSSMQDKNGVFDLARASEDAVKHFRLQLSRPETDPNTQRPNSTLGYGGIEHDHAKLMKEAAVRGLALICGVGPQAQLPPENDLSWLLAKTISPDLSGEDALADLRANRAWIKLDASSIAPR